MNIISYLSGLLQAGLGGLAAYLAAHVLLCLLPAFFHCWRLWLRCCQKRPSHVSWDGDASPWISYPASALGGFLLAVCSCTIMPLFASIYKKGAGIGPAVTFLFVGPAVNILAISFTGVQIGMDIALARITLSIIFGIVIGLVMAWVFRKDDADHAKEAAESQVFNAKATIPGRVVVFFLLLLGVLIAGTLQVGLLRDVIFSINLPGSWAVTLQDSLNAMIPPNPALGIEGVSVHGLLMIGAVGIDRVGFHQRFQERLKRV